METQTKNIGCLNNYGPSLLLKGYIHILIDNLYIAIDNQNQGLAPEMIRQGRVSSYPFETTTSIIPFFKAQDELIRGNLSALNNHILEHAWIKFKFNDKIYVFDPDINLIVPEDIYYQVFKPEELAKIAAEQVKSDILTVLNSKPNEDNWHHIKASNDINDSFYKTNISIKGEKIKRKILTLTTKYNHK